MSKHREWKGKVKFIKSLRSNFSHSTLTTALGVGWHLDCFTDEKRWLRKFGSLDPTDDKKNEIVSVSSGCHKKNIRLSGLNSRNLFPQFGG